MKLRAFKGAKDYNKLSHLPFNRDYKVRPDLMKSMNNVGFTVPINLVKTDLIDGKERIYIADGQHRAITAAFLDIEFYGVLVDIKFKTMEELVLYVARLSSGQKPWKAINYVESYHFLGYAEYGKLLKVFHSVPYTVETVATVLGGFRTSGRIKKQITEGTYKVSNLEIGKYAFNLAAKLSKYHKPTSRMILAIAYVCSLKDFNEQTFIKSYKARIEEYAELSLDDYSDIFAEWRK